MNAREIGCPMCGGFLVALDRLADVLHYRCRYCGLELRGEEGR